MRRCSVLFQMKLSLLQKNKLEQTLYRLLRRVVRAKGLEPLHRKILAPKTSVSAIPPRPHIKMYIGYYMFFRVRCQLKFNELFFEFYYNNLRMKLTVYIKLKIGGACVQPYFIWLFLTINVLLLKQYLPYVLSLYHFVNYYFACRRIKRCATQAPPKSTVPSIYTLFNYKNNIFILI